MGVSTDAILVFGFDLGEDMPECLEAHQGDLGDLIAAGAGIRQPADWENRKACDVYFKKRSAAEAACPIDIVYHCSDECTKHILAVRGSEMRANRGYPEVVEALNTPPAERVAAARAWCEEHGIVWQEPKWLLCSYWG